MRAIICFSRNDRRRCTYGQTVFLVGMLTAVIRNCLVEIPFANVTEDGLFSRNGTVRTSFQIDTADERQELPEFIQELPNLFEGSGDDSDQDQGGFFTVLSELRNDPWKTQEDPVVFDVADSSADADSLRADDRRPKRPPKARDIEDDPRLASVHETQLNLIKMAKQKRSVSLERLQTKIRGFENGFHLDHLNIRSDGMKSLEEDIGLGPEHNWWDLLRASNKTDRTLNVAAMSPHTKTHLRKIKQGIYSPTAKQNFMMHDPRFGRGSAPLTIEIETLFVEYLPEVDFRPHYKRCAVVGNSGHLLGSRQGELIDAHDAVIRINYAPTEGFEHDVGSKTTMDLVNKENAGELAKGRHTWRNSILILFESDNPDIRVNVYRKIYQAMKDPKERAVLMLNPTLMSASRAIYAAIKKELEREVKNILRSPGEGEKRRAWAQRFVDATKASSPAGGTSTARTPFEFHPKPMSGMSALYLALQICDDIDMYGFEAYTVNAPTRYHYFDMREAMTHVHSFDLAIENSMNSEDPHGPSLIDELAYILEDM
ncbi:glycosyltransferase 29 protein [Cymbomonas tetramitiformis]|uniref:Glycosyltransferase 29 protein n=1 Tax=Cymbomonas tetramitiformis TaxID=36881 RepID=A0AAE0GMV2_9CHLO|nr:glycosyltransferase 29 protein [Cymbomonas tetramitiformis]